MRATEVYGFKQWLSEKIEYHKSLSPKVWDGTAMKPEVRKKLLLIGKDFWDTLKLKVPVVDVQLTGSLANYNWTDSSDLDIHILIDFSKVNADTELVRKALDGQRLMWNERHPVQITGYDAECYIQDINEEHVASGLFSLAKNEWKVVPKWDPPQVDEKDVNEKARVIRFELGEIEKKIKGAIGEEARMQLEYLQRIKSKIIKDRKEGLTRTGEFSVENLAFKALRNDGTIERLITLMGEAYANIYKD